MIRITIVARTSSFAPGVAGAMPGGPDARCSRLGALASSGLEDVSTLACQAQRFRRNMKLGVSVRMALNIRSQEQEVQQHIVLCSCRLADVNCL